MMGPDALTSGGSSGGAQQCTGNPTAAAAAAAAIDATDAADAAAAEGHAAGRAAAVCHVDDEQYSRTVQEIGYTAAFDASYETGTATVPSSELKPWGLHVPQASALEELFACGFDAGLLAVWSESVAAGSLDGAKAKQQLSDFASSTSKGTASLAAPAGQAIRAEQ